MPPARLTEPERQLLEKMRELEPGASTALIAARATWAVSNKPGVYATPEKIMHLLERLEAKARVTVRISEDGLERHWFVVGRVAP